MIKQILAVLFVAAALVTIADARADTLTWTPATERQDGTPLAVNEISGHRVYFSDGQPGVYPNEIWIPMPNATSEVPASMNFERHAVVTTVDVDGRESIHSEMVVVGIFVPPPIAPPMPPTNLHLTPPISETPPPDDMGR